MTKAPIRPAEGAGTAATIHVQQDLAERTLARLLTILGDGTDLGTDMEDLPPDPKNKSLTVLRAAFTEAHCDVTLWNVHWWDLAGNSRIVADGDIMIPYPSLPDVGTVIQWQGRSYYVASHRDTR
jgi:hypothetical protein